MTHTLRRDTTSSEGAEPSSTVCPECFSANSFARQEIVEPVTDGTNTALVHVEASVCAVCGYALIGPESARKIEDAYARLTRGEVDGMAAVGVTYQA